MFAFIKKIIKFSLILFIAIPLIIAIVTSLFSGNSNKTNQEKNISDESQKNNLSSHIENIKNPVIVAKKDAELIKSFDYKDIFGKSETMPATIYMDYDGGAAHITGFNVLYNDGSIGSYMYIDGQGLSNYTFDDSNARNEMLSAFSVIQYGFNKIKNKKYTSAFGECIKQTVIDNAEMKQKIVFTVCLDKKGVPINFGATFNLVSIIGSVPFSFSSYKEEEVTNFIKVLESIHPTQEHSQILMDYFNNVKSAKVL